MAGCAHRKAAPPGPGTSRGTPPDLRGVRVMVFPVQSVQGVQGDADAEVAFGLRARSAAVDWVLPDRLRESLAGAPSLDTRIQGLPVGAFGAGEVRRVGDPLYGQLRRLGALVDAAVAFIPLSASVLQDPDGGAVVVAATLIDVRTGYVLWFGVVKGDSGDPGEPRALASAVDALARTLLWYAGS
jgi:hypothetical protein